MRVRHPVAGDRRVYLVGTPHVAQRAADPGVPRPGGLGFRLGEIREPGRVPARLHEEVSQADRVPSTAGRLR